MDNNVYVKKCRDYDLSRVRDGIASLLAAFGGAAGIAKPGSRVVVKPNLVIAKSPESAATTHPSVVQAVCEAFIKAGCSVTIADSPGGPFGSVNLKRVYEATGMAKVAEITGAVLCFDGDTIEKQTHGEVCGRFPILKIFDEADAIINVCKMKTHGLAGLSCAVKNMYGIVPGITKALYHGKYPDRDAFCNMVVDVCACVTPRLSIADGIIGMEGRGPTGGLPKETGVLLASLNPYALDVEACRIMGIDPDTIFTVVHSVRRGLTVQAPIVQGDETVPQKYLQALKTGNAGFRKIIPKRFRPLWDVIFTPYPSIRRSKCVGCGDCVMSCPKGIITIVKNSGKDSEKGSKKGSEENLIKNKNHTRSGKSYAKIAHKECIKCYCCHEMCKYRAVDFRYLFKK